MHKTPMTICAALLSLMACGGGSPSKTTPASHSSTGGSSDHGSDSAPADGEASNEFQIKHSTTAGSAHGVSESKIKATATEAAMKFFVVDKLKDEPVAGIVISLQAKGGKKYYTGETDELGYGEVLVPVGKSYDLVYLSLGEKDINAKVTVTDEPMQNIKLTLRYKRFVRKSVAAVAQGGQTGSKSGLEMEEPEVYRLDGVTFATNSAELLPESFERLDGVVEYMTYKPSSRIQVSGHTDNVGVPAKNKTLSEKRARACRDYLMKKGIDGARIEAVGHGDEQPIASNASEDGRQQNRRIEVRELQAGS